MAANFFSKQPNGKYCNFSTIMDCPVEINIDSLENISSISLRPYSWLDSYFCPSNMSEEEFEDLKRKMSSPNGKYERL